MLRLSPTAKLQCLLSGAVSATQPDVVTCFHDISPQLQKSFAPQFKAIPTNSGNAVDICDAPDPNTTREVDFLSLRNNDSASVTATIRLVAASTNYNLIRVTLLTLETLTYAVDGWKVTDVNGNVKMAIAGAVAATTLSVSGNATFSGDAFMTTGDTYMTMPITVVATGVAANVSAVGSRAAFTNVGATARQDFNLPAAAAELYYTFYCHDTDGIRIIAGAGDTIRIAGSVSAAAGRIDSTTVGSAVILLAINATEWVAISSVGTWVVT
jgi:hypothetical protein